jgi:hypothetical protein
MNLFNIANNRNVFFQSRPSYFERITSRDPPRFLKTLGASHPVLCHCCPNPLPIDSEPQYFPETSILGSNPATEMQNLAVLFRVRKFRCSDPFSMNWQAMNRSCRHRCSGCTHANPYFREFWIYFRCADDCKRQGIVAIQMGNRIRIQIY